MKESEQRAMAEARFERAKQAKIAALERQISDLQAAKEAFIEADWIAYFAEDAGASGCRVSQTFRTTTRNTLRPPS